MYGLTIKFIITGHTLSNYCMKWYYINVTYILVLFLADIILCRLFVFALVIKTTRVDQNS